MRQPLARRHAQHPKPRTGLFLWAKLLAQVWHVCGVRGSIHEASTSHDSASSPVRDLQGHQDPAAQQGRGHGSKGQCEALATWSPCSDQVLSAPCSITQGPSNLPSSGQTCRQAQGRLRLLSPAVTVLWIMWTGRTPKSWKRSPACGLPELGGVTREFTGGRCASVRCGFRLRSAQIREVSAVTRWSSSAELGGAWCPVDLCPP